MTWEVELTWGAPFFISVADSAGNYWSYGPLHSGEGNNSCLVSGSGSTGNASSSSGISGGAVAGAGAGGLLVGSLVGGAIAFLLFRKRMRSSKRPSYLGLDTASPGGSPTVTPFDNSYRPPVGGRLLESYSSNRSPSSTEYQVEPFVMPGEGNTGRDQQGSSTTDPSKSRSVYVVHHDGGRAPVTVYHEDGTEVVELPPRYIDGGSAVATGGRTTRSRSDTQSGSDSALSNSDNAATNGPPSALFPSRRPQATPQKARQRLPQPPPS